MTSLCLVVILAMILAAVAPGSVRASPAGGPSVLPCPPYCGKPPCPTPYSLSYTTSLQANATNVTISYSGGVPGWETFTNVSFGFNTSYTYPAETNQPMAGSGPDSVFLNFLEPSTGYDYKLVGWAYCIDDVGSKTHIYHGSYTGTWTTGSDSLTYISGYVYDANGNPAPSGIDLKVNCSTGGLTSPIGSTGTGGYYWIGIMGQYGPICNPAQGQYYVVSVLNGDGSNGPTWEGHWNETMVTFAPQATADFSLPATFVSDPVVQTADFSNANTSNGFPNSYMSYSQTVHYSDTTSACTVILGFIKYSCTTSSFSSVANSNYAATGSNLIVTQRYWVTGTLVFDALTRGFSVQSFDYYQPDGSPVLEGPSYSVPYTIGPSTTGAYPLYDWGGAGSEGGIPVYANAPKAGSVTINATYYANWTDGYDLTAEIPVGTIIAILTDGAVDFDFDVPVPVYSYSFAERAVASYSTAFNWTLYGASSTVPTCYAVFGVGGATSESSTTADAIGVWAYDPTDSGGHYSCPLP